MLKNLELLSQLVTLTTFYYERYCRSPLPMRAEITYSRSWAPEPIEAGSVYHCTNSAPENHCEQKEELPIEKENWGKFSIFFTASNILFSSVKITYLVSLALLAKNVPLPTAMRNWSQDTMLHLLSKQFDANTTMTKCSVSTALDASSCITKEEARSSRSRYITLSSWPWWQTLLSLRVQINQLKISYIEI